MNVLIIILSAISSTVKVEFSSFDKFDSKTFLKIAGTNGFIKINELQVAGKKKLSIDVLLRGFKITNDWKINFPS